MTLREVIWGGNLKMYVYQNIVVDFNLTGPMPRCCSLLAG